MFAVPRVDALTYGARAMQDEIWRVQLASGELRTMSLEELDAAFDEGAIDGETPVLAPGASAWTSLAHAAGLETEPAPNLAPSLSPVAIDPPSRAVASPSVAPPSSPVVDLDDDAFRPKKSRVALVVGIGAVAAIAGVLAFASTKLNGSDADARAIAAPATQAPPAATELPSDSTAKNTLTDEQKKKLSGADKAREDKARAKQREREQAAPKRTPAKGGASPFVNGGDKFDPLNGAL